MEEFIRENRDELTGCINRYLFRYDGNGGAGTIPDPPPTYDDDELNEWISNDEGLYDWARSEGVQV